MNQERWQQVEIVLQEALDLPPEDRAAYLDEACVGDDELRREAASLINAHDQAGDFIEDPAVAKDARVLAHDLPDMNIGRVIGAYRIVECLGSGGMGVVYLAEDTRLHRLVALKILPAYFISDETRLHRFQREARAVSALNHPNVLTIHEVGEVEGAHFIATEFIDGQTIRQLIADHELSLEEILDICIQVGSGLAAAHAAGIIHRDVKPENIMRRGDNLVKVLDFGIAKPMEQETLSFSARGDHQDSHTEAGMVLGTVGYMSPEQARGLKVDERTDVWSLGVVLYEMLAGYPPFAAATRMDTLVRILEREPQPLQSATVTPPCLEKLQRIIDRSLCKESEERYQTVAAMLADLRALKHELERVAILNAEAGGASLNIAGPLFRKASGRYLPDVNTRPRHQKPTTHHGSRQRLYLLAVLIPLSLALLAVLYFKRSGEVSTGTPAANAKLYKEMSDAERIAFIDEQEQRISALMGDRPMKLNVDALQAIKQRVDQYLARTASVAHEPGKERLQDIYQRATPHVPLITRSFEARKVPATIGIYLPMIESEYVPCFENSIGAKGLFQFLPSTARQYGVAPSDMCDVEKMTPAAAHYIADRMAELGEDSQSMTLVLLSYNRGAEWVRDTLRDLRSSENFQRNFWTLLDHRDQLDDTFRNENAGYVPMFFAAAIIGENPRTFELTIPPLSSLAGTSASKK